MKKLFLLLLLFTSQAWAADKLVAPGATSQCLPVQVKNSSVTTGAGLDGLAYNTAGLTCYYFREASGATATSITLAASTLGTYTSGAFKEVSAANMPGWYEFCPPDAAFASGASAVAFTCKGATNMAQMDLRVQLGFPSNIISDASYSMPQLVSESTVTLGLASGGVIADDQFNGMLLTVADYTTRQTKAAVCILDSVNAGDTVVTKADISGLIVGAGGTADYYYITPDSRCALVPETTTIPSAGTMSLEDMARVNYQLGVNKFYSTNAEQGWYRSDGTTVWSTRDMTDDGTTYNKTAQETDD